MKHVVIKTDWNNNMEYGMIRDLEDAIAFKTQAEVYSHPLIPLTKYIGHGTRYAILRKIFPKRKFVPKADVLWVPLIGPEDFQLDLFNGWENSAKIKILYLFDTFRQQFKVIKRIVKAYHWDLLITSYLDAVEPLVKITQQKWHCIPQGVNINRFYPRHWGKEEFPPIFIFSYGRRIDSYHQEIKKWCLAHNRWYDYTVSADTKLSVPTQDNYQNLANHLGSSLFSVSWPMELTHPQRAGDFSVMTCRLFEIAASGAVIIGQPPKDLMFEQLFGRDAVYPAPDKPEGVLSWLDELDSCALELRQKALIRRSQYKEKWSWENRVQAILDLIDKL